MDRESRRALGLLVLCLAYASLRYVVWGGNPGSRLPAWVMNKALAFSAVLALALAVLSRRRGETVAFRRYLAAFNQQALLHTFLTLALFSRAYYPGLFQGEHLYCRGELMLLGGAAAALALGRHRLEGAWLLLGFGALVAHVTALDFPAWIRPGIWPKDLPPLSLLGFCAAVLALGASLAPARK